MISKRKKAYAVAIVIQVIQASTVIVSKAAFDRGLSTFVYIFYRLVAASLFLTPLAILLERRRAPPMSLRLLGKMFLYALVGNTLSSNMYNVSVKYTSATVGSAMCNSVPVITFFLALLMRMEAMKLKSSPGMAKAAGITLCLAGVMVIALYAGPSLRPLNRHGVLAQHNANSKQAAAAHGIVVSKAMWIMWTFLIFLACVAWSVWFILQGLLLKEYPNKLLTSLIPCLFGTIQSLVVAVAMERGHGFSRWKLGLDLSLVSVAFSGIVGTGVCVYLQTWCVDMKGPVFLAMWNPLYLLLVLFCSSLLGETVRLGSVLGGILLVGGLYSVLWGKRKEETRLVTPPDHYEDKSSKEKQQPNAKECEVKEPAPSDQQV
ncbi:hypothetical protein HU200_053290 [Digitaria exilis]|uniref:WAT1-related protein n=1 Tax=Digitaria exilis TaxID=1010633 RepID=A0A835AMR7_9POAL|nr:hypothetical protein HU200_053290 [Digitaria exilis]